MRLKFPFMLLFLFLFLPTPMVYADNLQDAKATISNSRLSYVARVLSYDKKTSKVTINTTSGPSTNTTNLFPKDEICFANIITKKCGQIYKVRKIIDNKSFTLSTSVTDLIDNNTYIVAIQTNSFDISFKTILSIPEGGKMIITIPAVDSGQPNDGFPDWAGAIISSGFDLNRLQASDIKINGCTDTDWEIESVNYASGAKNHEIVIKRLNTSCVENSQIKISIKPQSGIVNPAKTVVTKASDIYHLGVKTKDQTGAVLDEIIIQLAGFGGLGFTTNVGKPLFGQGILYGYTSPQAQVSLTGVSLERKTKSDDNGYFEFDNLYTVYSLKEVCLQSEDLARRVSSPVCITPPYVTSDSLAYGPVILSPTLSLNQSKYFTGDEITLSGQTIPNTKLTLSFFTDDKGKVLTFVKESLALTIPRFEAQSDNQGNFSVSFPSSKAEAVRLFSQTSFDSQNSPKSSTLYLEILPFWLKWLNWLIVLMLILSLITAYYLWKKYSHPYQLVRYRSSAITVFHEQPMELLIIEERKRSV